MEVRLEKKRRRVEVKFTEKRATHSEAMVGVGKKV